MDYALRFLVGGLVVSLFAVLSDVLRPKSFAGLFGAAPSVALATLGLAFSKHGGDYVVIEGRSMVLGSIALAAYSCVVCQLLMRAEWSALKATLAALAVWLMAAIGLKQLLIG
ncbi:putative membrane protein (GlpM family) [Bradyrhizobium japonicum]|nr:putative membrane protein (GlpM family) [Bradyrhizobium japonicum]MCS3907387.1 putative membrane protein (GlpM family) [Bradyrhizobium japonicum]